MESRTSTKCLDARTVKYSIRKDCVSVGQRLACITVTSHQTFISMILKLEKVVTFNEEHLLAHPQTCGFERML